MCCSRQSRESFCGSACGYLETTAIFSMDESFRVPCFKLEEFENDCKESQQLKVGKHKIRRRFFIYKKDQAELLYKRIGKKTPMNYMEDLVHDHDESGSYLRFKHMVCITFRYNFASFLIFFSHRVTVTMCLPKILRHQWTLMLPTMVSYMFTAKNHLLAKVLLAN